MRWYHKSTVEKAFNEISEKFGSSPIADQKKLKINGIALSRSSIEIKYKTEKGYISMAKGKLHIKSNGLYFVHGTQEWQTPFSSISTIPMEHSNRLIFKVNGISHQLKMKRARFILTHFMRKWTFHLTGCEF